MTAPLLWVIIALLWLPMLIDLVLYVVRYRHTLHRWALRPGVELQRWMLQRVVRCYTCRLRTRRVRRPIAANVARAHRADGHRVSVRRG